jgi:hypothetical protein
VKYELTQDIPVPTWQVTHRPGERPGLVDEPILDLVRAHGWVTFRGVTIERLPTIQATGVDVVPSNATIYCADITKAFEYGENPKVIMAFRGRNDPGGGAGSLLLHQTTKTLDSSAPQSEVASALATYPHAYPSIDGSEVLYARDADLTAATVEYLRAYGYWIPGDPFEALVALFIYRATEE